MTHLATPAKEKTYNRFRHHRRHPSWTCACGSGASTRASSRCAWPNASPSSCRPSSRTPFCARNVSSAPWFQRLARLMGAGQLRLRSTTGRKTHCKHTLDRPPYNGARRCAQIPTRCNTRTYTRPLKNAQKNGTSSRFRNFFRRTLILDDHIRNATHSTSPPPPRYPFKHWVSTPLTPAHPISPQPLPNRNTAFPTTIDPNHTDLHHRTATHIQTTPIWALGDAHKFEPIGNDTQMQTNASTWDPWGRTTQRPHATTNGTRQTGTAPFNNSAPLATTLHSGAPGRLLTTKRNPLDLATCDAPQRMHRHGQK